MIYVKVASMILSLTLALTAALQDRTYHYSSDGNENSGSIEPKRNQIRVAAVEASEKLTTGMWGGEHVRMFVTENGADLEFDCAHGTVKDPIVLGDAGQFKAMGDYVYESHGPIRVGFEPTPQPATYTGSVNGDSLTLRVSLVDSKEDIGSYALKLGREAIVRKCR